MKNLLSKYLYSVLTFACGHTTDDKALHNCDPSSNRCSLHSVDIT